jgi:hypothetical protein
LVQPTTYGASDVEDDFFFELEEEQFTIHAKRLSIEKKLRKKVT